MKTSDRQTLEQHNREIDSLLKTPGLTEAQKKSLRDRKTANEKLLKRITETEQARDQLLKGLSSVKPATVKETDLPALRKDIQKLEAFRKGPYRDNLSENDRAILQQRIDNAQASIVTQAIRDSKLDPRSEETRADNTAMRDEYVALRDAYNGITGRGRGMIPAQYRQKLIALSGVLEYNLQLSTSRIKTYYKFENLVVTCNGALERFHSLDIDGKTLTRDKDYTVESGSTVATIYKSYLKGLKAGEHTITFHYYKDGVEEGSASAKFSILKSPSNNPRTYDDFNMGLWVSLLAVSAAGIGVAGYFLVKKKKK